MRRIYTILLLVLVCSPLYWNTAKAQCTSSAACGATTATGTSCARSNFYFGEILPNNGCGTFTSVSPYSPGEYFRMPVLLGGCYSISTCGSSIDTQISAYQGTATTGPFSNNDDNGPICSGTRASINFTPTFTDYTRVDVRQFNCLPGGTASITVRVRQNNNLSFSSASTDMCAGQTRMLTATPARVLTNPQSGSGNVGTFSGTGVSSTVFTAPTPAGSNGNYTITYDFGYCCTSQSITVFRAPTPANAGPSQVICSSAATLAANNPTYGTGAWTVFSGPGSVTNTSSNTSAVSGLIPGQTTVFTWTTTNGPCTASTDTVSITHDALPTPANAGANQSVCSDQATLGGNTATVGNGSWMLVGGSGTITSPSSPNSGVTGLGVGNNTFRWSITNGVCSGNTDDVVITRDADPTSAFAGTDQTLCDTSTTLAGNAPSVGTGTWAIIAGTGTIVGPANPNATLNGVPVGTTTLTWTISNGSCVASVDTVNVLHNAAPAGPTISGNISICEGSSTVLTATSGATSPSYTWWNSGTGGSSLASTAVYATPGLPASTTYWVAVTDGGTNCTSARSMVTVTVNALPTVALGADTTVCSNAQICLDAGPGFASYFWSNNGGTAQTACFTGSGNYFVIVTDSSNCQGSDTIQVGTIPAPQVNLGPDVSYCIGSSQTIGITGAPGSTYSWNTGATTAMITVSQAGTYALICTDTGGCSATDSIVVTENQLPVAAFNVDTSACPSITFTDQSVDATGWSWNFGDGGASSSTNPVHNYMTAGNGTYTVTMIATGQCGADTITQMVDINCLVGVELPSSLAISLYPNPNTGAFQLDFAGLTDDAHLRVFNSLGQIVYDRMIVDQRGDFQESIQLLRPAAGVYFVTLEIAGATITKRMIVE